MSRCGQAKKWIADKSQTWRACWWLIMPITFLAFIIIYFLLPLKHVSGSYASKLRQVDWYGSFLTLAWAVLVLVALSWAGTEYSWSSAAVLAPLLIGIALLGVFLWVELKVVKLPLIPLYIFQDKTVIGGMAITFLSGIGFYVSLYYLPQYFQQVRGLSAIRSGVLVLPLSVVQTVCVFIAGYSTSKTGDYWYSLTIGFAFWTIGLGLMTTVDQYTSDAKMVGFQIILGVGAGQTFQTSLVAIQAAVDRKDMATATGTRNFLRMLGGTIGLAACGTLVNNLAGKTLLSRGYDQAYVDRVLKDPVGEQHGVDARIVEDIRAAFGMCLVLPLYTAFGLSCKAGVPSWHALEETLGRSLTVAQPTASEAYGTS
jgi:predicted MFS family arabinose efflux permease